MAAIVTPTPSATGEAAAAAEGWGWLPALGLTAAVGLLAVAEGYTGARRGAPWAEWAFWAGILLIFAPAAFRLLAPQAARRERIGILAILAVALYLVKVLHSPLSFTFYDELLHLRTADDIGVSGRLFRENPLLPISPLYPGLESATVLAARATGLDLFPAGVAVVGAARLLLILALFLLYERAIGSARTAGLGALFYMGNPNYVFWGSQFAYESVALSFVALALLAVAQLPRRVGRRDAARIAAALIGIGASVTTHHVSSYFLVLFVGVWTATYWLTRAGWRRMVRSARSRWGRAALTPLPPSPWGKGAAGGATRAFLRGTRRCSVRAAFDASAPGVRRAGGGWWGANPTAYALVALLAAVGWLVVVASPVIGYLSGPLLDAIGALLRFISGEEAGRQYFRAFNGQVSPLWERVVGFAAVGILLSGLPFGLLHVWRRYARRPLVAAFAAVALAYPLTLALRLTQLGSDVSNRTSDFVFIALAPVLAIGVAALPPRGAARRWAAALAGIVAVVFVGGVIVGWPRLARLPGPYLVAADTRSVEAQGIAAAEWMRAILGPGNRIGADRINGVLMGSYGGQRLVTIGYDHVNVAIVVFAPDFGTAEQTILRQGKIQYVVVDRRLATALPLFGVYFEPGEPGGGRYTAPPDTAALAKLDVVGNVSRVFDSGDIIIYDVRGVSGAP